MGKQSLINPVQVTEPAELISEEDVLRHYASVAQFQTHKRKYAHAPAPRQRIKRPKQENNIPISQQEDSIPKSQTLGEFASRNGGLEGQPNVSEPELSVSPTPQAEPSARSTSSVAVNFVSPRNILPPPPPLDDQLPDEPLPHTTSESDTLEEEAAGPSSSDPRPQWSFTTTPLPPHLQRQAQLRPSAAPSNVSEEDVSEVDELATPGDGKGTTGGEDGALTGSPGRRGRLSEAGGNLLSLPRKLWSSIRPGILTASPSSQSTT